MHYKLINNGQTDVLTNGSKMLPSVLERGWIVERGEKHDQRFDFEDHFTYSKNLKQALTTAQPSYSPESTNPSTYLLSKSTPSPKSSLQVDLLAYCFMEKIEIGRKTMSTSSNH